MVQKLKRDRFRSQALSLRTFFLTKGFSSVVTRDMLLLFTQVELQAYAKAAQALRALSHPIDSGAQAKAIKGIGAGMANRIDAA